MPEPLATIHLSATLTRGTALARLNAEEQPRHLDNVIALLDLLQDLGRALGLTVQYGGDGALRFYRPVLPDRCPACDSKDADAGDPAFCETSLDVQVPMTCTNCGFTWRELYTFRAWEAAVLEDSAMDDQYSDLAPGATTVY